MDQRDETERNWDMIKKGDRFIGFCFDNENTADITWVTSMTDYIGVEGIIIVVRRDRIKVEFETNVGYWYPYVEFLQILREEKLKEIGI